MEDFHSSPSDIGLFLEEPALWFIKQFLGYRTEVGPSAHRGTAVEFGLAAHLVGENFLVADEEGQSYNVPENKNLSAKQYAMMRYRQLTQGEITDEIEDEAKNVPLMLDQSIEAFKGITGLIQRQRRMDVSVEGIPLQGYLDFVYADKLIDLKSTKSIPSKPRPGHVRQMAIYTAATGLPARLCYASAKKFLWHDVTPAMHEAALREVHSACRAMRRIRTYIDNSDWRTVSIMFPPRDLESFYYDPIARHIAADLWSN